MRDPDTINTAVGEDAFVFLRRIQPSPRDDLARGIGYDANLGLTNPASPLEAYLAGEQALQGRMQAALGVSVIDDIADP